jgi:competence protein ComEA
MKPSKSMFDDMMELLTENSCRIIYIPHEVIEDYNATYHVMFDDKVITTGVSSELGVPLNEIWISELWKPYERFIIFHELREIYYKAEGLSRDVAHKRTRQDESFLWDDDPLWRKMNRDIAEMDRKTKEKKLKRREQL